MTKIYTCKCEEGKCTCNEKPFVGSLFCNVEEIEYHKCCTVHPWLIEDIKDTAEGYIIKRKEEIALMHSLVKKYGYSITRSEKWWSGD